MFKSVFAQSRREPITYVTSSCPSDCLSARVSGCITAGPTGLISLKLDMGTLRESIGGIQMRLKSDKNIGHFT